MTVGGKVRGGGGPHPVRAARDGGISEGSSDEKTKDGDFEEEGGENSGRRGKGRRVASLFSPPERAPPTDSDAIKGASCLRGVVEKGGVGPRELVTDGLLVTRAGK